MKNRGIILSLIIAANFLVVGNSMADPIVELAAPRISPIVESSPSAGLTQKKAPTVKYVKKVIKGKKKLVKQRIVNKPKPIVIKYDEISKMIEYGNYDNADNLLKIALGRNSKDINAISLKVLSLAKQGKIDFAQKELNLLLKIYPNNSILHYAQGIVYYQQTSSSNMEFVNSKENLLQKAQNEFKKAVNCNKNNAGAYNALGVTYLMQGNQLEARNNFNKSLAADKKYSLAIDNLGTLDFIQGNDSVAELNFKKALTYNPQNSTAMYHLAQLSLKKGDANIALKYLNDALYLTKTSPAIYNLIGKSYYAQGNEAAALNAFRKSISIKPEFIQSYLDLANIYQYRGDNEFAIEQLKTALSINQNNNLAKLKLADISLNSKKFKEAADVYSQLIGIDGFNNQAMIGLANCYFEDAKNISKSRFNSSKEIFKTYNLINDAIKLNPENLELILAKLKMAHYLNLPFDTQDSLNKIINSDGNSLSSLIVKAEAYISFYDYKMADEKFDEAIKLSKSIDDDIYITDILLANKQYDKAQFVLEKILEKNPNNLQAQKGLEYISKNKNLANRCYKSALAFKKQKNYSSAIEYLENSIALNPNNVNPHFVLAQLYEKNKNYDSALMQYKAYLGLNPNSKNKKSVAKKIKKYEKNL